MWVRWKKNQPWHKVESFGMFCMTLMCENKGRWGGKGLEVLDILPNEARSCKRCDSRLTKEERVNK
jgi:hypothetical protein